MILPIVRIDEPTSLVFPFVLRLSKHERISPFDKLGQTVPVAKKIQIC